MSVVVHTSRLQYKEPVKALVHVTRKLLPWGADVNARKLLLNALMLLRLMEMWSYFASDIADMVQVYSSVDEDKSMYLQIRILSDAYHNVLKRLSKLKEPQKVGKIASRRKQRRIGLELEPWMDSIPDIDIGYDAPPPSFTAGLELQNSRRARTEAAKCRIAAIRKAPTTGTANAIDSLVVYGNEDACPPQKNSRKKLGRKRRNGRDHHIMYGYHPTKMSGAPDSDKKKDCVIELLLLHGANEPEIKRGQYRRLLELHVFSAISGDR
ncbi:hypothetical protein VPH35_110463 [Triticum aestivum]